MRLAIAALALSLSASAADLTLTNHTRIVFEGDSIMDAKKWTHYVSSYLILMNPTLTMHCQTEGRGGTSSSQHLDSSSISYQQFSRLVLAYSPTYVFVMLGHNGGDTAVEHAANYVDLVDNHVMGHSGAEAILIGAHPQRTMTDAEAGMTVTTEGSGKPILGDFDDENEIIANARGLRFVKLWHVLKPRWTNLDARGLIDGSNVTHPGTAGQIAIAYHVIAGLGFTTNVSAAVIDATGPAIISTNACTVSGLTANAYSGVDFSRLDERLPWAVDPDGMIDAALLYPAIANWQSYTMVVTNLSAGTYDIRINGSLVATATNTVLATGVNMSTWTQGPVFNQLQEVLGRIRDMHGVDRNTPTQKLSPPDRGVYRYRAACDTGYKTLGFRGQDLIDYSGVRDALAEISDYDDLIHAAAQPVIRLFSIRKHSGTATPGITAPRSRGILLSGSR